MKKSILILSLILVSSCMNEQKTTSKSVSGPFAHTVFFWFNNPDSKTDRMAFETSLKKFINQSVYIQTKHIGLPAATDRDVIDNTYTYSLLLTFANKGDQDKYQDEPNHKTFIEESSNLWKKVVVYDSENIYNQ